MNVWLLATALELAAAGLLGGLLWQLPSALRDADEDVPLPPVGPQGDDIGWPTPTPR